MRHGRRGTYVQGCRCPECREAHRAYMERWRRRSGVSARARSEIDKAAAARWPQYHEEET